MYKKINFELQLQIYKNQFQIPVTCAVYSGTLHPAPHTNSSSCRSGMDGKWFCRFGKKNSRSVGSEKRKKIIFPIIWEVKRENKYFSHFLGSAKRKIKCFTAGKGIPVYLCCRSLHSRPAGLLWPWIKLLHKQGCQELNSLY